MIEIDVNRREDFMERRGQSVGLIVGPFHFWVSTADGLTLSFAVGIRQWSIGWHVELDRTR